MQLKAKLYTKFVDSLLIRFSTLYKELQLKLSVASVYGRLA